LQSSVSFGVSCAFVVGGVFPAKAEKSIPAATTPRITAINRLTDHSIPLDIFIINISYLKD
jgi:hypothetical protein